MNNPFVTNGYAGAKYFCDREKETKNIVQMITNENNLALISPRRLGKTDLIYHCFAQPEIRDKYHTFIVDIYSTASVRDFVNLLGKAVLDSLKSKGRQSWEKFINAVSSLRQNIGFDMNGYPSWSIGIGEIENPSVSLDEIFCYLESADKKCLVAIDEFQQITRYNDKNIEATLRTYIQKCTNTHFIFSGSQRHLMGEIFTSPSRPFFQSVTIMNLPPIPLEKYTEFVVKHFEDAGKSIDKQVISCLYEKFDSITSYMQRIMNLLFVRTPINGTCTIDMIDSTIEQLLDFSSDTYEAILYQMPEKQRDLFVSIALDGKVKNISGGEFVKKHKLLSPSSVLSAVKGLLEKDFITEDRNVYSVYDKLFELWIKRMYK
ncbi:MAG: ATP-binding protein [Bacteroidales bacterium]|nr:ATP-binding protein [Bacteroidales bacterium]